MTNVYASMKKVILSKKQPVEVCYRKLNNFYAVDALTEEQYLELVALVKEVYGE